MLQPKPQKRLSSVSGAPHLAPAKANPPVCRSPPTSESLLIHVPWQEFKQENKPARSPVTTEKMTCPSSTQPCRSTRQKRRFSQTGTSQSRKATAPFWKLMFPDILQQFPERTLAHCEAYQRLQGHMGEPLQAVSLSNTLLSGILTQPESMTSRS